MSLSTHPSLLRPAAIFADNVPFSFLTPEFVKTSQLLQNSVYDSCQARCFLAVGLFDVADSLASHLGLLRETLTHDPTAYLQVRLVLRPVYLPVLFRNLLLSTAVRSRHEQIWFWR